jgi:diguanylate cyclase (GGDEF)-like protein/PAS domain S-box-containing protein
MSIDYLKLYTALLETNRLLLRERNIESLYKEFCRIVVESGEFNMAWIGVPDDVTIYFKPLAIYAKDDRGYNYFKNLEVSYVEDVPVGRGIIGRAFRDKRNYILNDYFADSNMQPWFEEARLAGFKSAAAFPIMYKDNIYAVLVLYSTVINYFNNDITNLLSNLSHDIGFAIYHINAEKKLKELEERWRIALENSNEGVWDWDCKTGKIFYSKKWKEMLGFSEEEIGDSIDELYKRIHPDDLDTHNFKQMECINNFTDSFENVIRLRAKDGSYKWILSRGRAVERNKNGTAVRLLGVHIDITEAKENEEKLLRLNRFFDTLYRSNELIIRVKSKQTLFKRICSILTNNIDIELALIALPDTNSKFFRIASFNARNENGLKYLKSMKISPDESIPEGKGAAGKAFRLRKHVIMHIDDPDFGVWREAATLCNFNVVGYFPLIYRKSIYGVMGIYSSKPEFFDEDIIKLIINLSEDVAFAIYRLALEEQEKMLKKDLVLAREVYENSQECIVLFDSKKSIISVNKTFEILSGYKKNYIIRNKISLNSLFSVLNGNFDEVLNFAIEGNPWHDELFLINKNGSKIPVYAYIYTITYNHNNIYMLSAVDISQRKEMEEAIDFLQNYDNLTALPNRNLFVDRLNQAIAVAKRFSTKVALLYIDIDNFKLINDNLGQEAGNLLLRQFANRLSTIVREGDTLARISGDDFALMVGNINSSNEVISIINKIRNTLKEPFKVLDKNISVTVSIGSSVFPDDTEQQVELLSFAEYALKLAKENGRNNYVFYSPELNINLYEDFELLSGFPKAIKNNQFVLYYQPKVSFSTGKIVGAEALIRWNHPKLGLVPPLKFIPLAETHGFIGEIGAWVIKEACKQICEWNKKGIFIENIAINISALQFNDKNLKDYIDETISLMKINPSSLEAELTESIIMKNIESSLILLKSLKELSIKLSLDDFGTGYSSLSYLTKIPLDTLKIDRSFVINMTEGEHEKKIIKMIINLAKSLNLKVLAEGVETEEHYRILKEWGCDEYQGYYFSKPLPADKFEELFVSFNR